MEGLRDMNIAEVEAAMDNAIQANGSTNVGIRVGVELFEDLAKAGKIKETVFTERVSGRFPQTRGAYKGHPIEIDPNLDPSEYAIGPH